MQKTNNSKRFHLGTWGKVKTSRSKRFDTFINCNFGRLFCHPEPSTCHPEFI